MTAAAVNLLNRAGDAIKAAAESPAPAGRFVLAHLAAKRAAAAVIAVRGLPPQRGETLWDMLARAEPALERDARMFAAAEGKREAADAGLPRAVSAQDAEGMLEAATAFLAAAWLASGLPG
jgi:hypothetical protein